MKDIEIISNVQIPPATLSRWKRSGDWREKVYTLLSNMSYAELMETLERNTLPDTIRELSEDVAAEYRGPEKELFKSGCNLGCSMVASDIDNGDLDAARERCYVLIRDGLNAIEKKHFQGIPENEYFIRGAVRTLLAISTELDRLRTPARGGPDGEGAFPVPEKRGGIRPLLVGQRWIDPARQKGSPARGQAVPRNGG